MRKPRFPRLLVQLLALLVPLLTVGIARTQFIAFNDHAPGVIGVTTSSNATTWDIFGNPPGAAGHLKDINTGASLPVSVAITLTGTVNQAANGGNPAPGTPLYNTFNGYVDFQGAGNADAVAQVVGAATVTYAFTGLSTNKTYSFIGSAVRGGVGGDYALRWSLFSLTGASSFSNNHTSGAYTNGLPNNQVAINTGVNTNGDMADWEKIVPGPGGTFSVTTTQYTNTLPGGGTGGGPYCYALDGFRLQEFSVTAPPAIASASNSGDNSVRLVFTVPVSAASATNLANYSLTNLSGSVPVVGAAFVNSATIQLTTASQSPFAPEWLTINNVADAATGTNKITANSQILFTNVLFSSGYMERQLYYNITGTAVSNLTSSPNYPNNPDEIDYPTNMSWPLQSIADNYGGRMAGYLIPPLTGTYYFAVESDDNSQLFLSTNDNPGFAALLAQEPGCCETFDAHTSAPVTLTAGMKYYILGLMKEGGGNDYFNAGWKTPTNETWTIIPGQFLGNYLIGGNASVSLSRQPTNTSGVEGQSATFTAAATGNSSITTNIANYQWQLNGFDIPGATAASYTTPTLAISNNGAQYRVLAYVPGKGVFSSNAVLTVSPDTTPPTVVSAENIGLTSVQIVFSKPVQPASATNLANYAFTNGLAITAAAVGSTNTTIVLTTASLTYGSNYTLVLNGIQDQAGVPNTIAPDTMVSFTASQFASDDIGGAAVASSVTILTNGLNVTAAGGSLGGVSDQFNFQYELHLGNFDVTLQLAGLGLSDIWAEAGLIARQTLDPGSPFVASLTTPGLNGDFMEYRNAPYTGSLAQGNFPANFPNTWLRLKRVGNVFTAYAGYDGLNWSQLGSVTISMPAQIYLGLSVSSHSATQATTAQFRNFAATSASAVVTTINPPHEPLGPSSRKSFLAISELMYKPAPRTDGRNLEFIELYNSNPFFEDISGYQVVGDSMNYTFAPNSTIPAGAFIVLAAAPADLTAVYGITNVLGPYTGSFKKSGTVEVLDEVSNVLLTVPYSNLNPWPIGADGTGHSIVLANPTYGEGDPRAWSISDVVGGSPGTMDGYTPSPLRSVVINEILAHSENPAVQEFVELYNHGNQSNDVSGCIITDDTTTNKFVIPPGTVMPPRGFLSFNQTQLGFTPDGSGSIIYFIKPDGSRILDAVQFEPQADGVSLGRSPDGGNELYPLTTPSPGASNSPILIGDIVINELMYDPITENEADQYLELYNKGTNTVSLANWHFTSGITYSFPSNATIAPSGYVVVAENATNLFAKYSNLNPANTFGNYGGKLSHHGERVALAMPQNITVTNSHGLATNVIYVVEDEVTYGTGGRWGQWSSGGGSSLELIDPKSNHRLAANWGDSDETQKSSWVDIETTGVLDNGNNYDATIDYAQIGLLDVGECLIDNVEVHSNASAVNLVLNSGFETGGLTNWTTQGCHVRSSLENSGYLSSHSLHVRASDRIWTGDNSCEMALQPNGMVGGQTATLRFKARWLHGWPEVLMRLNGNWLEAFGKLPLPNNLGSPGAPNSIYITNAGPAIYSVSHSPPVPPASQAVVVTAQAHDVYGGQTLTLKYRIDPATNYTSVPMKDDGTGGDAIAGDGVFSATIPGQATGTIVAFCISGTDSKGTVTRFPALLNNNAPVTECVIMFGDSNPGGSFGVYHLWITQTNATRWSNLSDLSNESLDCTIVNDTRIIYGAQARFAGSPYHQGFDTPYGNLCHYKWIFPDDDKFLGATSFNKIHQPGNGAGDDASIQREQIANSFLRALGVPWLNRRYVAVYVNGNRRGPLMEDAQCPDSDDISEHFPNDSGGWLYKMQPWFEFGPAPSGESIPFNNNSWCNLAEYTTTGGARKIARYRYNYEIRSTPDSADDFTNVFSLCDAANSMNQPNYVANMENLADMENWMRVFAGNHAAGNWDSVGSQNAQNLYGYIGQTSQKYALMMWDFNIVIGNSGSWLPGQNLFDVGDPVMYNLFTTPVFRRMYWRALQELVNGPLNVADSGPLIDAKYQAFTANGLSVEDPNIAIKPWLSQAHDSIASQIAAENTTNFTVSRTIISNDIAFVSGTAPVNVAYIWIDGAAWPLTWTSVTNWTVSIPLKTGTNTLSVTGVDLHGNAVPGDATNVTAIYNGNPPSPVGHVVINEIMCDPVYTNGQYVELYNNSAIIGFDLSGWAFNGLDYTFPEGSVIGPNSYLVLAADRTGFAGDYSATNSVFDTFPAVLPPAGTLSLVQPSTNGGNGVVVTQVKYQTTPPWPTNASGTGSSLQLIAPLQDNWRAGNWKATYPPAAVSPGVANTVYTALPAFPQLWINELQADNLTGITNSAGQHTGWLELYNPGSNLISLSGLYLANSYSNLTAWAFPAGASINPGQFKVVFADGQTNLSTLNELHTSFTLTSGTGSLALSRLYLSQPQVIDFVDYSSLGVNHSYGSFPDGQSFNREEFFYVTPGGTNNSAGAPLTVFINEWMAGNTKTLQDPLDKNKYDDWFELYNPSSNTVSLQGCYLTNTLSSNLVASSQVPSGYSIPPNGFLVVWADKITPNGVGDLHVNFKLAKAGTSIALYNPAGSLVDYVTFGAQSSDVSQGRYPDGSANLFFMPTATPRTNNIVPNTPPVLAVISNQVIVLGRTLSLTASATDSDIPAQTLTYSLGTNAPVGAAINSFSGLFTWTPSLAPSTNSVSVIVTDNGTPSLSATQTFTITVIPPPQIGGMTLGGNQFVFTWPSVVGINYQLEYVDDLTSETWFPMGAELPGTGNPISVTNGVNQLGQRFFRLKILP